jgi:DNA-binding response OmpR family regulator
VITDVVLPGMTGVEFVREFASIQSAYRRFTFLATRTLCWRARARDRKQVIPQKPFSAADLLKRVRLILTGG